MQRREASKERAPRVTARRRPAWLAVSLAGALLGSAVISTSAHATPEGPDPTTPVDEHAPYIDEHTGHVDPNIERVGGLLLASDPAPLGPFAANGVADGESPVAAHAAPTIDEAFTLHSRPSATRKILLDFDGETVTTQYWNGGETIEAAPYSRGNDQTDESFSAEDLLAIEEIWSRVAEDFAAWDVDVTTEDPGADGLARNGVDDVEYGVRAIISPTYEWYSSSRFGGVAYIDTFAWHQDLPAWVFSGNLASGSPKSTAEAASHEIGHTLGLSHDGITTTDENGNTTTNDYYSGHGDWAPIMGIGYYRQITQWSKGEYPGATEDQDDLAEIDGYLTRLGFGTGEGSSAFVAPSVGGDGSTSVHTLSDGGDIDEHSLRVEQGPVTVSVERLDPEGNLLAELRIRDASGVVIDSDAPTDPTSLSLEATVPSGAAPGVYTVEVESIGWTPAGDPGFTSYASIGDYVLTVEGSISSDPNPPPPDTPDTPDTPATPPPPPPSTPPSTPGDRLTAVTPRRVLDTREPGAPVAGPMPAGREARVVVDGLPDDVTAVVVNLTAVAPRRAGYFSLGPCGVADADRTSSLNFAAGRNIANSVIVPVAPSGQICLFSSVQAHALLDLTGFIGSTGDLSLEQLGSTRVVDTRDGMGISQRLAAGVRSPISLSSVLGSDTVDAVALNVTAIRPSTRGFLTIDDCAGVQQLTSSLNFAAGEIRGNNGVFALSSGQDLCITSSAATHVTIDVTGDFGRGSGLTFVASTSPERVLDTRDTGRLDPGAVATFDVDTAAGANTLERSPIAASINLTATRHDDNGFVTAWSCGDRPDTSALNPSAGTATANGALVELSGGGTSCLFHATGGHLIVDLAGWWI